VSAPDIGVIPDFQTGMNDIILSAIMIEVEEI
jgi:hypothetical protein